MELVRLLNTPEAKMMHYIDDIINTLEWFVDRNMEEISLVDLIVGMYFKKDVKHGNFQLKHTVFEWIEKFNRTISMDRSKINQRKTLIELRKLFWMVDKNRSGTIDFDE